MELLLLRLKAGQSSRGALVAPLRRRLSCGGRRLRRAVCFLPHPPVHPHPDESNPTHLPRGTQGRPRRMDDRDHGGDAGLRIHRRQTRIVRCSGESRGTRCGGGGDRAVPRPLRSRAELGRHLPASARALRPGARRACRRGRQRVRRERGRGRRPGLRPAHRRAGHDDRLRSRPFDPRRRRSHSATHPGRSRAPDQSDRTRVRC